MKTDFDREMDSLLRAQARRDSAALTEPGGASSLPLQDDRASAAQSSAHLDADELNAYAENALPVSTRMLYAAHLADCVQCRHLVTRLALAAGTPAQLEQPVAALTESAPLKVSWQARIGALLSARAWRYAVPMLALLLISAIGLLSLLRPAPNERSIAESVAPPLSSPDRAAQPKLSDEEQHSDAPATANSNKASAAQNSGVPAVKGEVAAKEEVAANDARPALARPRTDTMVSNTAPAPAGSATVTGAPVGALSPPQPTPAPIAEATGITAEMEAKTARSAQDQIASAANTRNVESEQREGTNDARRSARARSGRAANANDSRSDARVTDESLASAPSAPVAPRAAAKPQGARSGENTSNAAGGSAQQDESPRAQAAAETRSIANRKFRRQGRAWVDTAYSSTQAVTIVRRNSEQYRALVADEPELRRIADALGGEVTVVWKGRAYRIR
jgi:hypothetical protein